MTGLIIDLSIADIEGEEAKRQAERELGDAAAAGRESLASFVKQAWHIIEPSTPLVWGNCIDFVCAHLEAVHRGKIRDVLINIPPGHMKSILVNAMWPAWIWTQLPSWSGIFSSYDLSLTIRDSLRCRDIVTSEWYRDTFEPDWDLRRDQNMKTLFVNTAGGFRQVTSVGGAGTGLRAHAVVCDDPHNLKARPTDDEFADTRFWWFSRMSNRLRNQATGSRVVIGQRIDDRDLSAGVLERGGYVHVCLPSEFNPAQACTTPLGSDWRTDKDELLFPERFPVSVLEDAKRDLGPDGYAAQHDQDPVPKGGNIVKDSWVAHWFTRRASPPAVVARGDDGEAVDRKQRRLPDTFSLIFSSWDLRFGKSQSSGSSWVTGHKWGLNGTHLYLLDRVRGRWGYARTKAEFVRLATSDWKDCASHVIEAKASGEPIEDDISDAIPGIELWMPHGDKIQRLEGAAPWIRSGHVWLPHPEECEWVHEVVMELLRFPRYTSDDHVDCLTQAVLWVRQNLPASAMLEALAKM